jgi:multidrug transporter EmrE-like cation transporter
VLLNAFAQIAMKKAILAVGMEWAFLPLFRLFTSPWMITCLVCYAVSVIVWAGALKMVPTNYAFPFMALAFVCVALMAKYILHETIPPMRWLALAVIVVGVCLQAFSGEPATFKTEEAKCGADASGGEKE